MSAERYARVKELFHAALQRAGAERTAFLAGECGADDALRREVEELLAFDEGSGTFLQTPLVEAAPRAELERVADYRVLRRIGSGGMGVVYEAQQEHPRRSVALKVLHPALATTTMLRRFEFESRLLARLDHPCIARVLAAGSSDVEGRATPWIAMELVEGESLRAHCDLRRASLAERLELVAQIAEAVEHAHRRGVIHRDLKPANVLVDREGRPRVLDFGIARVVGETDERTTTLRTMAGQILGTLAYMSPEQAGGDPDAVDTRSDVYSLGAMLFELVAGRPPLDLAGLPLHRAIARIVDGERAPLRLPDGREPPLDVAVITAKALAREPDRRYASASALAEDLRRYLADEPILARPPTTPERLRRFVARNRALVAGAATTFLALAAGLVLTLWQVRLKTRAEGAALEGKRDAEEALAAALSVQRFLLEDVLASPAPDRLGRDVRVVDVLGPAALAAQSTFGDRPLIAAQVLDAVAVSYDALGLYTEAGAALERAAAILAGIDAPPRVALRVREHQAQLAGHLASPEEALRLARAVHDESRAALGPEDPETLEYGVLLGLALWNAGEQERGLALLREVAETRVRVLGPEQRDTLQVQSLLSSYLAAHGAPEEAIALLQRTVAAQERALGPSHPHVIQSRFRLAWMLWIGGQREEAERIHAELDPVLVALYGEGHAYTARMRTQWADVLAQLGRSDEAQRYGTEARDRLAAALGPDHPWTQDARLALSEVYFRAGQFAAGIAEAEAVVAARRATLSDDDENLGHALNKLGRCYQDAGALDEAVAAFAEAEAVYRRAFAQPTPVLAQALLNRGVTTRDAGRPAEAVAPLREALAIDVALFGPEHAYAQGDRSNLARALMALGAEPAVEAVELLTEVVAIDERNGRQDTSIALGRRHVLAEALAAAGRTDEARAVLRAVAQDAARALGEDHDRVRHAREALAELDGE